MNTHIYGIDELPPPGYSAAMRLYTSPLAIALGTLLFAPDSQAIEFYVAPDGDDANSGSRSAPFATVERAQRAVRNQTARGNGQDVVVFLRNGRYTVTRPLRFGPEDGGNADAKVTYAAFPGESPVVSGGRRIAGWTEGEGGVWETRLPDLANGQWKFRELFVNGERRPRARHPNEGFFRVAQVGPDKRTTFQFNSDDIVPVPDLEDVELVFLHDWSISRVRLANVDPDERNVTLADPVGPASRHFAMDWFEPHPRYFLENSAEYLDAPGEWHLNADTGLLRYKPVTGESVDRIEVYAPVATSLLEVRGEEGRPVRNLWFAGIHFEHCAWPLPENGYAAGQAGFHERRFGEGGALREPLPAALQFERAEACGFVEGSITRVGGSGIWFGQQCRDCEFRNSVVRDVSGNGVMVGEDRSRHVDGRPWWQAASEQATTGQIIRGSLIEHCGRQFYGAVGIWVGLADRTRILDNEIRSLPYTGVSIGWMWNPTPTPCRQNVVERNHIHHVMQILSDGGGIYTLGFQPGSRLRENVIHDVPLNMGRAESNGMFLDEGTTDCVVEGNVIFNIDRSPLRFHRATQNLVRSNLLVVKGDTPPIRYNNTQEADIKKVNNTVLSADQSASELLEQIEARRSKISAGPSPTAVPGAAHAQDAHQREQSEPE